MNHPIWLDTHVHVSDTGRDGEHRPRLLEDLLDVLDREEADLRFVICPDGAWLSRIASEPESIMEGNRFIHDLVTRAPGRLYGACMVNPNFVDESLQAMDVCFGEWGFVQLGEMLQYMMDYDMDSPEAERVVRKAVEFDVPVQVHVSTAYPMQHNSTFGLAQLEDLCRLADRVPEAKYILAHAVGMPDDDPPVVDAYLDFIEGRYGEFPANFWVEIRDFDSPGVRSALDRVPLEKLIAGTDWVTRVGPPFLPYGVVFQVTRPEDNPYPPCIDSLIGFLKDAGLDDDAIALIGSGNAMALLGLHE